MNTVIHMHPQFDLNDPETCKFDLVNPKPKDLLALQEVFNAKMKTNPDLGPLPVHTGWNNITPAIGINLLLRNPPGANRRLEPAKSFYYGNQMARDDWKATGQPILVDANGVLLDSQHRLYGGLIAGATFKSYVVTDIESIPNIFAYIDNGGVRNVKDALQTAGYNGVAQVIGNVIKFAEKVRLGLYNASGIGTAPVLSPAQLLSIINTYPNAKKAARSAASDWVDVSDYLHGRKVMVAYVGMRIIDLHGEDVADDFFEDIMQQGDNAPEYALALRREVEKDNRAERPMRPHHTAAMLIKVFNAWRKNETLGRRWMPQVNEDFPTLIEPVSQADAAE